MGTIRWITVGGRTSAYVTQLQKHPNKFVESRKVWKKKGVTMSTIYIDESSDEGSDESESDLTPISDEEQAAETTKRKRRVSASQTSTSAPGSRTEIIVLQGYNLGIESNQKAEGIV